MLTLITILALGAALIAGHFRVALDGVLVVTGGTVLSFLFKMAFDQPRPDLVGSAPDVFTSSFPSSHAMMSLVAYFTLAFILGNVGVQRRLRHWLYTGAGLISLIVGTSRTYLGSALAQRCWLQAGSVGLAWLCSALWIIRRIESREVLIMNQNMGQEHDSHSGKGWLPHQGPDLRPGRRPLPDGVWNVGRWHSPLIPGGSSRHRRGDPGTFGCRFAGDIGLAAHVVYRFYQALFDPSEKGHSAKALIQRGGLSDLKRALRFIVSGRPQFMSPG